MTPHNTESGLPEVMVIMAENGFYVRYEQPGVIKQIDLPIGLVTPISARRAAIQIGYNPTHWSRPGETPVKYF